ncbi:hypothetical protein L1987_60131 [Smallanthus sonchifolius]|uniref:Uncharacterized protein n=1 Tax=Smallanthus sonchifolius TaxID=185202 RepID=A0ACB9D762_9ASTR|nr:hypothetical protein L1987_60131 [Smallanthus sonchifolius]
MFRWENQPEIVSWRKYSENGQDSVKRETYGTSGCVRLFKEAMKENKVLIIQHQVLISISLSRRPGIVFLLVINSTISFIEENNVGNVAAALTAGLAQ